MNTHWTQNDIRVNDIKLHYTRTGHGDKPPLVLVHGFSDNGLLWTPTARDLESTYDVIMPDMRGHGLSARVRSNEHVDMAADVAELIRVLALERPIVGGHSMGAMVAYQIGLRFPELASAIFLEDPAWLISPPDPVPPAEHPIVIWAKSLSHKTMEALLAEYHQNHPNWSEEMIRLMCQSKTQIDPTIAEIMSARMHAKEWNWQTTLQDVAQPLLLVTADPELGAIVTPEVVTKVRELNANVIIANVPDVGHLIRFDNYDAFMKAVWAFLQQL